MMTFRGGLAGLLIVGISAALLQAGCGGGGGSDGPVGDPGADPPPAEVTEAGRVVQGPVAGALVFADLNGNLVADGDEPSAETDADGGFELTVRNQSRRLVSRGGYDTLRGRAAYEVLAPGGAANITPLTTLVALADHPDELKARLALLLPGEDYDTDLSQPQGASRELFKLAKGAELLIELFDGLGIVQDAQHRLLFRLLGGQVAGLDPVFLNFDPALVDALGEAAALGCRQVAGVGFTCEDPAGMKTAVVQAAQALLERIAALPSPVSEEAVETALVGLARDPAPLLNCVRTGFVELQQVLVDGQEISSGAAVPADFASMEILFRGHNDFGVEKSYPGATVTLIIDARQSRRQALIEAKGVKLTLSPDGTPNMVLDAGGQVTLKGRTAEGITISGGGVAVPGTLLLQDGRMLLDREQLEKAVKARFGILPSNLLVPGEYVVQMRVKGLPLADWAFTIRVI
ncbi:hypothetical protein DESUT3_06110 [Desulfuromonas versatilis]|uniref:Carboxypeptidase regulatory-like domain-containing protein n=1 Tax=Desulfuromonas versatilis TaxID=2802975 RepID=A0ABN6DTT8_9BACT|nr:hypothetical protein [Desulfuromonas versatilis]BCR03542.1 hypothetical protein DESUT3_06110 [Desulfuromonas versatilis]